MRWLPVGRPTETVSASSSTCSTCSQEHQAVVSVGPYMCSRRRGPPASRIRRTLSASAAWPPKSTSRSGAKMSGCSRESWFSSAVVW